MDRLYTTHDISRLLQVDPSTVSKWIDRGLLIAFRTPGGHRRVRMGDLRSFLVAHQMPVPEELGTGAVRLLAIEPDKALQEQLTRAFKMHAQHVELTVVGSAIDALLMINELKPHGVLVDANQTEVEPMELCRKISTRKSLEGVRVLLMAQRSTPELVALGMQAGAVACLAKPIDAAKVLELFRVPLAMAHQSPAVQHRQTA